jgi:hypothetical protein
MIIWTVPHDFLCKQSSHQLALLFPHFNSYNQLFSIALPIQKMCQIQQGFHRVPKGIRGNQKAFGTFGWAPLL